MKALELGSFSEAYTVQRKDASLHFIDYQRINTEYQNLSGGLNLSSSAYIDQFPKF